jgi:hypothetical protein
MKNSKKNSKKSEKLEKRGIQNLPELAIRNIFIRLGHTEDRLTLSQTCRRLHQIFWEEKREIELRADKNWYCNCQTNSNICQSCYDSD